MDKILGWPVVKAEDVKTLQELALLLRGCCNAMTEIQYMDHQQHPIKHEVGCYEMAIQATGKMEVCSL